MEVEEVERPKVREISPWDAARKTQRVVLKLINLGPSTKELLEEA